jgi:hypothetical protein
MLTPGVVNRAVSYNRAGYDGHSRHSQSDKQGTAELAEERANGCALLGAGARLGWRAIAVEVCAVAIDSGAHGRFRRG